MNTNIAQIKTIIYSVIATLVTLFVFNHLWLFFILLYLAAGYKTAKYLYPNGKSDYKGEPSWYMEVSFIYVMWPIGFFVDKRVTNGIRADFKSILGGRTIKFRSPIVFEKL